MDNKTEARKLRKSGVSLAQIAVQLGAKKGTVGYWVKDISLTPEQKSRLLSRPNSYHAPKKPRGEQSKLWILSQGRLSKEGKARVAEAAVLLRAVVLDLRVYGATFDGDKTDWLVQVPSGKLAKIQVKATRQLKYGLPVVGLRCSSGHNGKRRYCDGEFDFIVGYDLYTDIAYVYSADEVTNKKNVVTTSPEFAEQWQKVLEF